MSDITWKSTFGSDHWYAYSKSGLSVGQINKALNGDQYIAMFYGPDDRRATFPTHQEGREWIEMQIALRRLRGNT